MADFNLGAEVSMDVDPIKASARTLERELKGINQSLREQRKEFKQNEMSAEQLADMEKDLGRAIKAQEGLLTRRKKSFQDVKEEMAKSNEVTDEQRIKLQKADAAYRKAQNQLNGYTKELKDVQVASKTLGKSTDDIKGKLNSLRNEVKLSEAEFQKSSKATNDYEKHINNLSTSLNKSETNIKQLEDNLKIVSELKGENSREAKKLSSEIEKERLSYSQLEVSLSKVKNEFEDVKYENSELAQSINKTEKFIDNMKGNVSALSNELKRSSSSFKGSSQEADDYKNHLQQLTNIQTKQKNVIKELEDEYKKVTAIQGTSSQQAKQLKDEIDKQRTSFTSLDTQINQVTKQYDEYRLANSQANITLGEAKRRLESYNNALEVNTVKFKNSNRSVESYQNQLNHTNATITQHKAVLESLKQRYEEVAHAQGKDSTEAEKLQKEMYKEAVALEVAQSRADELSDELDEVAKSQTKVALASKLMRAGFAGSRDSMDRIATTLRNLGEITQGVVGEIMATQFANLIPIMGSVVSAGAGIGGMLTSLAGGAIGLGGAFGIGMGAINAFAGQATYALKKLEDGELALTNETRRYQSVLSSLKNEWEGLIAQNQAKIFNTLSNGINIARTSLSKLSPFLTRTAGQIEGMSGKMLNWIKTSSNAKTAFNILNTQGTQAFGHLLQGAYHFVDGTTAVFNKLSPLFVWASQGFENMALSFRKWVNSVEGSKAINGFVEYTKTNLPIVGRIFGNVFAGLFNLFSAFSGHSHNVLLGIESVTEGFRKWSEELKRSDGFKQFVEYLETNGPKVWQLIKNITGVLWGLVKGMAPVASFTLSVTNAITGWMASMVNTHPMIGKILGSTVALTGAILLLLKPIFLVKGALTGMRGALLAVTGAEKLLGEQGAFATLAIKKQGIQTKITSAATKVWNGVQNAAKAVADGYRYAIARLTTSQMINTIKTKIATAAQKSWQAVVNAGKATADAYRYAVGRLATSKTIAATKTKIATIATKTWTLVTKAAALATRGLGLALRFMTGPIGIAITVIGALTAAIIYLWKNNETFRNFVIKAWNSIKNTATSVFGFLKVFIPGSFKFIKDMSIKFLVSLKNGFVTIVKSLVNAGKRNFNILKAFLSVLWSSIKNNTLKTWLSIKNGTVNAIRSMYNGIKKIITNLKNFIIRSWQFIKNKVVAFAKSLASGVKKNFSNLYNFSRNIFGKLKNFAINIWKNIRNKIVSYAKSLYSNVKKTFNNLYNFSKNIFGKLKRFLSNIWKNIRNTTVKFAKSLYSGVKNAFSKLFSFARSIFSKLKNWMSSTWRKIRNSTVNFARNLYNGVKRNFSNLYNGTRNIFSKTKNFMSNTWRSIKNNTVNMAKNLWNSVRRTFNNMSNGLKNIIGKIKGHITGMVNAVKKGLNKLIGGVNWVAGKIGMKKIPTFKFHTGTESTHTQNLVTNGKLNQNTLATVGDKGKGNGPGGFRHETIIPPKGKPFITPAKDTTMPLSKGTRILNGVQTHAMLSNGMTPMFNTGTIPRFASGTKKKLFQAVGETAGKFFNSAKKLKHNAMDSIGNKTKQAKEWGSEKLSQIKGAVGKGTKWLSDKVGDIADWVGKPGKLLNKVLGAFGVNMDAFGIAKSAEIPYNLMKAMFGKLKDAAKNLIDGWLEDEFSGGGGYNPYANNSKFKWVRGWTSSGHAGIDYAAPTGTPIPSPIDGKVIKSWVSPYGGGNETQVWDGSKYTHIFMHQSKRKVKIGDRVRQGQIIGLVGNTGNSTGPHLHWQVNKGKGYLNNHPDSINPLTWAKQAAKSGGGSKAANKWKPEIKQALKANGLPTTATYVNAWIRQIQTESGGNAGAVQGNIGDINNRTGNLARGLLQVIPPTFAANKLPGHGNIMNGLDNAMAAINYAKKRYGRTGMLRVIGQGHGYATGTNNARKGYATVFEKGGEIMNLRGGEQIIPNDVSIAAIERVINSDIFNRTQSAVYEAISRFADGIREEKDKQQQTEMRRNLEYQALKEQNVKLTSLVEKMDAIISTLFNLEDSNERIANKSNVIDRYSLGEEVNTIVDKRERHKNRKARFKPSVT